MAIDLALIEDPCALAKELRLARLRLIAGEAETLVRFDKDEVRYSAARLAELDTAIREAEDACAAQQGVTIRRRRFAKTMRHRPY